MEQFIIEKAAPDDSNAIYALMESVSASIHDKNLFVADTPEWVQRHIKRDGFTLIARHIKNGQLMAYLIVRYPRYDSDNLGLDMHLEQEALLKVAHMESVVVSPDARGHGLQRLLLTHAEKLLQDTSICHLMATVAPENPASLKSFITNGYTVVCTKEKYGGRLRHILHKAL